MTGTVLLGLILISMAWLFFLAGLAINYQALRRSRRGIPLLPGMVGSLAAFFSVAALDAPWPWLWILLPLALDPYCLGGIIAMLLKRKR